MLINKMYKNHEATDEKIIFLVTNPSEYLNDGFTLKKFGYDVEFQEWESEYYEERLEQMRRADVLADYVYVEEALWVDEDEIPIRPEKLLKDCRAIGIKRYLNFINFRLYGAHVILLGKDFALAEELVSSCATITMISPEVQPYGLRLSQASLIIVLPDWKKNVNCYPIYIPVIDCGGRCINTIGRDIIEDDGMFRVMGIMEQIS